MFKIKHLQYPETSAVIIQMEGKCHPIKSCFMYDIALEFQYIYIL